MSDILMGFQLRPRTNIRCQNCNKMIGKDCTTKIAYEIREGTGRGVYCSGRCANEQQSQEDRENETIDEMLDFDLE